MILDWSILVSSKSSACFLIVLILVGCTGQAEEEHTPVAAEPTVIHGQGNLHYGIPVNGTLPPRIVHQWQLDTAASDQVQVSLLTNDWIPWLDIPGPATVISQRYAKTVDFVALGGIYTVTIGSWTMPIRARG